MSDAKQYIGEDVVVTFDAGVCQHAGECVRGLPSVFDTKKRPWIAPDAAPADEVRAQVERCPSGALQWHNHA
ncbi:MAG: (4Fe-4S)-binding protein [Solirubrobacterales bacterium]